MHSVGSLWSPGPGVPEGTHSGSTNELSEGLTMSHSIKTVLIAEDDQRIRRSLRFAMEHAGYRVFDAENSKKAMEWLFGRKENGDSIDLLLADIDMPWENVLKMTVRVRRQLPVLPIIVMTGSDSELIAPEMPPRSSIAFLAKPFEMDELLTCVALAASRAPGQRGDV